MTIGMTQSWLDSDHMPLLQWHLFSRLNAWWKVYFQHSHTWYMAHSVWMILHFLFCLDQNSNTAIFETNRDISSKTLWQITPKLFDVTNTKSMVWKAYSKFAALNFTEIVNGELFSTIPLGFWRIEI